MVYASIILFCKIENPEA